MPHDDAIPPEDDRPILPWKLIAGAFVHFVVPAYLVALAIDTLLAMPKDAEAMLRHALPFSGAFLAIYALVALAVSLAAAAIDPLLRARRSRHPLAGARLSERRLSRSIAQGRGLFGAQADAILSALKAAHWDHGDPRYRALAADLDDVVRTAAAALPAAPSGEIAATATRALEHLQDALDDLNRMAGERRLADAKAAARYVELRHGPSDFSSGAD